MVAIATRDSTLLGDERLVSDAIRLSRKTLTTTTGNLCWSVAHNLVALPVAGRRLLNPILARMAMVFSTALSSARARGVMPPPAVYRPATTTFRG